LSDLQKLEQRT